MAGPAVEIVDLVKRYPKRETNAVDGISFRVASGECFGLLGPNGAGKTTTIGVLTTRVKPTGGSAFVAGVDVVAFPVRARTQLGVVPQRPNLDRSLDVRQNLLFHASYHGVPAKVREARAVELLDQFGLADRAKDKVDRLSGGQMQRVMIARALMHSPPVLFLDEPATGLDPAARIYVWDRIRDLKAAGVTILLTTHDMDEAAELADRVGHRRPRPAARARHAGRVDQDVDRQRDPRDRRRGGSGSGRVGTRRSRACLPSRRSNALMRVAAVLRARLYVTRRAGATGGTGVGSRHAATRVGLLKCGSVSPALKTCSFT